MTDDHSFSVVINYGMMFFEMAAMDDPSFTKRATVAGTLTIFLANITTQNVMETIVLAGLGTVVSFFVSYCLKRMMKKRK